ncbi:putative nucleotidyltransferase [Bernardetia litoralis DSM 6794]|uniref:Putative nucleotidyltransferase n=1 Tax=Bernardetia litoralis (strain ATCC 23117 / DSM 6794 / NBRC 15988 / NCIMB 1366 / Fx l1 / Sio-4) TaxID=880071 RepID=I4AKQ8_BERLS|nr:nucleotidyltransferase domain-containing protein [Bernardetia litoralis]AFM04543.1 putative nucleotidyltransferase [Bernardetia litoralis DSM 6794]
MINLKILKQKNLILLEALAGSKAYGTDLPTSDTDIKGIFILPKEKFYGLEYVPQVSDKKNDIVFYEIKRFVELLAKNNPSAIEIFHTAKEDIFYKNPILDLIKSEDILSKMCKDTFAGYALTQIKKAKGLKKKIFNPMPKERKTVLDFCYILNNEEIKNGSILLKKWLESNKCKQENCGLSAVNHIKNTYLLFYQNDKNQENSTFYYKGILKNNESNEVNLSSIPKGEKSIAYLYFNKEGYAAHCKEYKQYWEWVEKRNDTRYENTLEHSKNYDAKNMMHTFRLLDMAIEILEKKEVIVKRPNREELLKIRSGFFTYKELIKKADQKIELLEKAYQDSTLPEFPNVEKLEKALIEIRSKTNL